MGTDESYDKGSDGVISLEGILVKHFFMGLDRLQATWNGEEFNRKKFTLQILYLIRMLPDPKKQKIILSHWNKAQQSTAAIPGLDKDEVAVFAGMEVVTEIVMFICDAFELVSTDIVGPATSKQYQRASIEIPDMPEEEDVINLDTPPVGESA